MDRLSYPWVWSFDANQAAQPPVLLICNRPLPQKRPADYSPKSVTIGSLTIQYIIIINIFCQFLLFRKLGVFHTMRLSNENIQTVPER